MVDFKIKGTKLPVIPLDTKFRCSHWQDYESNSEIIFYPAKNYVSYGYKSYKNEIYILAENEAYDGTHYFMFKELDIIKLAKEQGMIEEELIQGNWYEGEGSYERWLFKFDKIEDNKYYTLKTCTPIDNYKNRTRGHFLELKNIKPANMEEVYKFFPDEKQEEFKLPEKWRLKTSLPLVEEYLIKKYGKVEGWIKDNKTFILYSDSKASSYEPCYVSTAIYGDYTEITFEQFKKYVLKENNNMEKEIIGYKLIKPEYAKAAIKVALIHSVKDDSDIEEINRVVSTNSLCRQHLIIADVLNLWFEPVYKIKEKVISVGGKFDVVIKDNGIWHKSDDITEFVEKMLETFGNGSPGLFIFGKYEAAVSDVTFQRTGCQAVHTKLSDWKKVYETYKNMQ